MSLIGRRVTSLSGTLGGTIIDKHSDDWVSVRWDDGVEAQGMVALLVPEPPRGAVDRVEELERLIREHVDELHPRDGSLFTGTAEVEAERLYVAAFGGR